LTVLLDPTSERSPTIRPRLPRAERLDGLKIGILDIASAATCFCIISAIPRAGIAVTHYANDQTRVAPLRCAADRRRGDSSEGLSD
jgi:hypothetical protein